MNQYARIHPLYFGLALEAVNSLTVGLLKKGWPAGLIKEDAMRWQLPWIYNINYFIRIYLLCKVF
jgi:hypothetical protein